MINTNRLKAAIVGAGMSQVQLAKVVGMNKNTLSAKINGKASFNVDEVMKICATLGIQSDQEKCLIFLDGSSRKRDEATTRIPS